MTRMRVSKEFTFDAAHNLPNYGGRCERLHGHTYRLAVTVEAEVNPETGVAYDFSMLGEVVREVVIGPLDHTYLNEAIPTSSAENVATWIWGRLQERLPVKLVEITLWETPTSAVTYTGD